jgi:endonuclease YncB( thermonuclease family)
MLDTLRAGGERYRLAGIDAPEIGAHARCDAERRAGEAAAAFARRRVAAADVIEARPAFQPRDRRRSWPRDRYGRRLAFIALDGEDLGRALIRAHLAAPWRYGRPRRDWCANPVAIR